MKKYRLLFTMALWLGALAIVFSSCNEELVKSDYDYQPNSLLTLSTIQFGKLEKVTDEAVGLEATITDAGQSEIYDQGFIYGVDENFTTYEVVSVIPETLETGDGDFLLAIEEFKIPQGKNYYFKAFVLTKDGIAVGSETKSINLPVTWEDIGTVEFDDQFWTGEKADVTIQKFVGQNRYRLVDIYSEVFFAIDPEDPDIEKCRGKYLEFYLDEKGNADKLPDGLQDIGLSIYGYELYWHQDYAGQYCIFTNDANVYTLEFIYSEYGDLYLGGKVVFEWIDGYPGEIPESKLSDFNSLANEEIPGALSEFVSTAYYNETWNQSFTKVIDQDTENKASQYKNLYYLPDLYYEGYGLAFYYDGETITIPENQPTGTSFKKPLYVSQSENIESSVVTTAKGVSIYTLGLNFHYEDGTSLGEFTETFYYSKDPVSYAIADFYGNYKLTAPSQFNGYPDADMDVTIAAGASENTFIITGIDIAEEVKATFDPSTSTLSVAPQELADSDITLYTTTPDGKASETAAMDFNFNISGNLVMTATSEADGYLLYSESEENWIDGYYYLTFIPQLTEMMKAAKTSSKIVSVHKNLSRKMNAGSHSQVKDLSKNNFAVQAKGTVKKMLKKETGLKPLF
jgi:hypothetical protein